MSRTFRPEAPLLSTADTPAVEMIHNDTTADQPTPVPILGAKGVTKSFGGNRVLDDVSLTLMPGTVHAVAGHNGAGKSTLMKILSGIHMPDTGSIHLNGVNVEFATPRDALAKGISIVHQELSVINDLDVAENIYLGREPIYVAGITDRATLYRQAEELLTGVGVDVRATSLCEDLSVGQRQMVEIVRAISWNAQVVILDEPTAALGVAEQDALFALIRKLKAGGIAFLYISHRLDEVFAIADEITVLRNGKNVGTLDRPDFQHSRLVEMMLGHPLVRVGTSAPPRTGTLLAVSRLSTRSGDLHDVSFDVAPGEIVGLAGMLGSGRSELLECLFGIRPSQADTLELRGTSYKPTSPNDAMSQGVGLVPEERKVQGIFPGISLKRNIGLASIHDIFSRYGIVTSKALTHSATHACSELSIHASSIEQDIALLSGGNQQKAILARWLIRRPALLLLDEPTAGVDIGAKEEIYEKVRELAASGVGVVFSSSEFDELIGLCHKVLVLRHGTIVAELKDGSVSEHAIVTYATGGEQ